MTEDFVIKYLWSAVGYGLMSIPILFPGPKVAKFTGMRDEVAHRTESEPDQSCTRLKNQANLIRLCIQSTFTAFTRRCRWTIDVLW